MWFGCNDSTASRNMNWIHGLRALCLCLKAVTIIYLQKCYWDVMIPLPPEIRTGPLDKMESVQMQSNSSYKCTEEKISKRNICAIQIAYTNWPNVTYTLTSVCIFLHTVFYIFLRCWQGEFI